MLKLGSRYQATIWWSRMPTAPWCSRSISPSTGPGRSARRGLKHLRFHDLRHAHATHLLASGTHPKVASERLGHSKVGITLDLYSHVIPGMQKEAAATVDAALQKAIKNREESSLAKRLQTVI